MAEGSYPSNVHVLKPRAMSLSDRLDSFLEKHALTPNETPIRCDPTRPRAFGINAINCASCGQAEYLTRDYCRCGHYLRGQLEDEFLAWEVEIFEEYSRIVESVAPKLRRLRYLNVLSLPFIVVPFIYLAFLTDDLSIFPMVWIAVGFALLGLISLVERRILKPIAVSQKFLESYTLETFLVRRSLNLKELDLLTQDEWP